MPLPADVLEILACPECGSPVAPARWPDDSAEEALRCSACGALYPVREGIPELVESEAWKGRR